MKNSNHTQAAQSRVWIQQALFLLMEDQLWSKITITDIVKRAGLSRLTFYRHFESKEETLLAWFDDLFAKYHEELKRQSDILNLETALCKCFAYWDGTRKEVQLLVHHDIADLLQPCFSRYLCDTIGMEALGVHTSHIQRCFIEGGLFAIMLDWALSPAPATPQELADNVLKLMNRARSGHP